MISRWESERERVLRLMKIPARLKLEWLRRMNELVARFSSRKTMAIRRKMRSG